MPRPVSDQQVFLAAGSVDTRITVLDMAVARGPVEPNRDLSNALISRNFFVRFFNHGSTNLTIQFRDADTFTGTYTLITGTNFTIAGGASNSVEFTTSRRFLELFGSGDVQFSMDLQGEGQLAYSSY